MKNILSQEHRDVLEQYAWSNVLLAFDYDGTLAPIVHHRDHAAMRRTTRSHLEELATLYPCVVISGRALDDVRGRVRGVGVLEVHGNHGLEPSSSSAKSRALVREWRRALESELGGLRGVEIEDKTLSIAVHYRRSREKKKARAAILRSARALENARMIGGKQVVNVLPDGTAHKGLTLERVREKWGCDTAIYVGDDETDEDVFALGRPGRLLTIRVGAKRSSLAAYCIRDQRQIDVLLGILVDIGHRRVSLESSGR
jgi:trehalose 6-phosphate phosphatase